MIEHFYENGWINIKISDSGVGIPDEKIQVLGTPFFTSKTDGTGLGLTQAIIIIMNIMGIFPSKAKLGKGQ